MAKVIRDGYFSSSSPDDGIHTGEGILRGFLICNTRDADLATVIFYDNTTATGTILAELHLGPSQTPCYIMFPRDHAPRFSTGLSLTFTNATVSLWSVGFTG
jgi:hypothetical protein